MSTGTSIFLMAVGATLKYAVTFSIAGVSLTTVGVILMVAGAVGAIASILATRGNTSDSAHLPPRATA